MKTESSHLESSPEFFLSAENITVERSRGIGEKEVCLRQVSLEVPRSEILVLAGEQGAGTSIFCQLLATGGVRRAKILSGELWMEKENLFDLSSHRRKRVCRSHVLYAGSDLRATFHPKRSVLQNLRDFVAARGLSTEILASASLHEKLYRVGCIEPEKFLPQKIEALTDLEVARIILLRVLLSRVGLFVCDGAALGLDPAAEMQFLEILVHLQKEEKLTIVLTAGCLAGVDDFADQVAIFYEGGILESGEARSILSRPQFLYTEEFISSTPRIVDLPRELGGISREAVLGAEEAIHGTVTTLNESESQGYR